MIAVRVNRVTDSYSDIADTTSSTEIYSVFLGFFVLRCSRQSQREIDVIVTVVIHARNLTSVECFSRVTYFDSLLVELRTREFRVKQTFANHLNSYTRNSQGREGVRQNRLLSINYIAE